jgi:predicted cobalt transporter CbtA
MDEAEKHAKEDLGCKVLTLNTVAAWCWTDEAWKQQNGFDRSNTGLNNA